MGSFISGRVTTSMLTNNYLDGMNKNLSNLQTINNQLTTGKEISRPSDNPYKVARTMQLYSSIDANKQYNEKMAILLEEKVEKAQEPENTLVSFS